MKSRFRLLVHNRQICDHEFFLYHLELVDKILVIYPTLEAVSKLKLKEEILDWFGLPDKEDITFGDVAIKYGHIII